MADVYILGAFTKYPSKSWAISIDMPWRSALLTQIVCHTLNLHSSCLNQRWLSPTFISQSLPFVRIYYALFNVDHPAHVSPTALDSRRPHCPSLPCCIFLPILWPSSFPKTPPHPLPFLHPVYSRFYAPLGGHSDVLSILRASEQYGQTTLGKPSKTVNI